MKTKLFLLALLAGGSMFAQSRFSFSIGIGDRGYYAPSYGYRSQGFYRPSYGGNYGYREPGYGSFGYDPEREHERAEWRALRRHQIEERRQYGGSPELWEHHLQEQRDLEHEQWHERHGDWDAADGSGHRSAEDGYTHRH
jgi:hypothetical protein